MADAVSWLALIHAVKKATIPDSLCDREDGEKAEERGGLCVLGAMPCLRNSCRKRARARQGQVGRGNRG